MNFGLNRHNKAVNVADYIINTSLRHEDANCSLKEAKNHLKNTYMKAALRSPHLRNTEMRSNSTIVKTEEDNSTPYALGHIENKYSGHESDKKMNTGHRQSTKDNLKNHGTVGYSLRDISPDISVDEIKTLLSKESVHKHLTKHDIYFRNQNRFMKNSILPS